jgi:hypothetical protein
MYADGVLVLKRTPQVPILENLGGYESMFLMDHFADCICNPLFWEFLIYCFTWQDQKGVEVSFIRSSTNQQ